MTEPLTEALASLEQADRHLVEATASISSVATTPEAQPAAEALAAALDNTARATRNVELAQGRVKEAQVLLETGPILPPVEPPLVEPPVEPPVVEPPPIEPGLPKHPVRWDGITVNPDTLAAGYRDIKDGDTLWLEAGNYGSFDFTRKFSKGIVIRPKDSLKSRIVGRWLFWKGEGHWLYDNIIATPATLLGREKGAVVFNSKFIATKNKVESVCGFYGISNSSTDSCSTSSGSSLPAQDFFIGWNDFVGSNSMAMSSCCHIKLRLWDGRKAGVPEFRDFAIYNNSFWDGSKSGNDKCDETFNLYIGNTKALYPDNATFPNARIFCNIALPGNQRRFLYLKRGVEKVAGNLCLGARNVAFTQRYGVGTWHGNKDARGATSQGRPTESAIFGGGRGPKYQDGRNDIRGNEFDGTVSIRCGTSNKEGKVEQQACDYGLMVGNKARGVTTVGKKSDASHAMNPTFGGKLNNFTLLAHDGQVVTIDDNVEGASCKIMPEAGPGELYVPPVTTIRPENVGLKG